MNIKTTIFGALAALLPYIKSVVPHEFQAIVDGAAALAIALMGYFAADKK